MTNVKTFLSISVVVLFALTFSLDPVIAAPPGKITTCHKGRTLMVPATALIAHLAHGDTLGACNALVVPHGLGPGDAYHVIFVSSTTRDALSTNIADYDAHVQAAADVAGIGSSLGITWLAVASTSTVNAFDHLVPLFTDLTNVPIYNQAGTLVSPSFVDLWSDSLSAPIGVDETGAPPTDFQPWTGTAPDGSGATPDLPVTGGGTLGGPPGVPGATIGAPTFSENTPNLSWVSNGTVGRAAFHSVYGLSSEVTATLPP